MSSLLTDYPEVIALLVLAIAMAIELPAGSLRPVFELISYR